MDRGYLAELCDARDKLCGFCEANECDKCIVTRLIDDAFSECDEYNDDDEEGVTEMSKWIQIWYSWGDQECPVEVPDGVDAWEYMQQIVAQEVFVSQQEYPHGCTIWAYEEEGKVILKYHQDEEYCYYLITDEEDYDPDED